MKADWYKGGGKKGAPAAHTAASKHADMKQRHARDRRRTHERHASERRDMVARHESELADQNAQQDSETADSAAAPAGSPGAPTSPEDRVQLRDRAAGNNPNLPRD